METVDYDYQISSYHSFGEFVLLKEFFTSGLCTTDADEGKGEEVRLPKYSRDNFQYKDKGRRHSCESDSGIANVRLSVNLSQEPLSLSESCLSPLVPTGHQAYQPSSHSAIVPISNLICFCHFKVFSACYYSCYLLFRGYLSKEYKWQKERNSFIRLKSQWREIT